MTLRPFDPRGEMDEIERLESKLDAARSRVQELEEELRNRGT